jgi:hypothetical protein
MHYLVHTAMPMRAVWYVLQLQFSEEDGFVPMAFGRARTKKRSVKKAKKNLGKNAMSGGWRTQKITTKTTKPKRRLYVTKASAPSKRQR